MTLWKDGRGTVGWSWFVSELGVGILDRWPEQTGEMLSHTR